MNLQIKYEMKNDC